MDCKELMERHRVESIEERRQVKEVAKMVLSYLGKKDIPLTPANYDEWFYVMCKAIEDGHVISDKNLEILYSKYIEDFYKEIFSERQDIKNLSKSLQKVTQGSEKVLDTFDSNLHEHNKLLGESAEAIEERNIQKIDQLQERIKKLEEENKKLKEYLQEKRLELELIEKKFEVTQQEMNIDALTDVYNRRKFDEDLQKLEKENVPFGVIFLDLDDFKKINDTYGHQIGDKVLQEVGEILRNYLRKNTFAYRYGGEEFVIVLLQGDIESARAVAERLREVIEQRSIRVDEHKILNFSATFGVAQRREGESVSEVLQRADEALYEGKRSGKNRVIVK